MRKTTALVLSLLFFFSLIPMMVSANSCPYSNHPYPADGVMVTFPTNFAFQGHDDDGDNIYCEIWSDFTGMNTLYATTDSHGFGPNTTDSQWLLGDWNHDHVWNYLDASYYAAHYNHTDPGFVTEGVEFSFYRNGTVPPFVSSDWGMTGNGTFTWTVCIEDNHSCWVNTTYTIYSGSDDLQWAYGTSCAGKRKVAFNISTTEASDLQVCLNLSKTWWVDDLTSSPPTIGVHSSDFGELHFMSQYWNSTSTSFGFTELPCWMELIGRAGSIIETAEYATNPGYGLGQFTDTGDTDWMWTWVKLPQRIIGDKTYTNNVLWIYYENLSDGPHVLNYNGSRMFNWYQHFNWDLPSNWVEHTSGAYHWFTLHNTAFASDNQRLHFRMYLKDYDTVTSNHFHRMFYIGSNTNYNPPEMIAADIFADRNYGATDSSAMVDVEGRHSSTPWTGTYQYIPYFPLSFQTYCTYDLAWTGILKQLFVSAYLGGLLNVSTYMGLTTYTNLNELGFLMHPATIGTYSSTWSTGNNYLAQRSIDNVLFGDYSEIHLRIPFLGLTKWIGQEAHVTSTPLVFTLPHIVNVVPANGAIHVALTPVIGGELQGGFSGFPALKTIEFYLYDNTFPGTWNLVDTRTGIGSGVTVLYAHTYATDYSTLYQWKTITYDEAYPSIRIQQTFHFTTNFTLFADFTYVVAANMHTVSFTDTSLGNVYIDHWYWDFGDGSTSEEQNPTHYYYSGYNQTVTLYIEHLATHETNHTSRQLNLYIAPTPIVYSQFDWSIFVPFMYIIIIFVLILVVIFLIFRSGGKKYVG